MKIQAPFPNHGRAESTIRCLRRGRGLMTRFLPETRTVSQEAAPAGTIPAVLVVAILAALLIVPAFALFYTPEGSTS